jgi:hypothetical protein
MPRIDDHSFGWLTDHSQSSRHQSHRHKIYQHEHAFESGDALRHPRHNEKEDLRYRWVDRVRIFFAVNVWINGIVAQSGEPGINRHIEIRIDTGSLEPSIPDVAINIG